MRIADLLAAGAGALSGGLFGALDQTAVGALPKSFIILVNLNWGSLNAFVRH